MEEKQLLIVSKNEKLIQRITAGVSEQFEVSAEKSIHTAFNISLKLLPNIIFFDKSSYIRLSDFRNIKNFKSNHFLAKTTLLVYCSKEDEFFLKRRFSEVIDGFIPKYLEEQELIDRILQIAGANSSKVNYWHECFMGLFNLIEKPIILLEQDSILAMNDSFKKTFRVKCCKDLNLTDFVNHENKAKVKTSLRNFARGKHLKATTNTTLLVNENKQRNAKVSFSKLSRELTDQFVMFIDFTGDETIVTSRVGSDSSQMEKCFGESEAVDYSFTKREVEIIKLLCKGYKTKEISKTLFISPKTIEKHRSNIIKRTNSETILESIIFAINNKLIDYPVS